MGVARGGRTGVRGCEVLRSAEEVLATGCGGDTGSGDGADKGRVGGGVGGVRVARGGSAGVRGCEAAGLLTRRRLRMFAAFCLVNLGMML